MRSFRERQSQANGGALLRACKGRSSYLCLEPRGAAVLRACLRFSRCIDSAWPPPRCARRQGAGLEETVEHALCFPAAAPPLETLTSASRVGC